MGTQFIREVVYCKFRDDDGVVRRQRATGSRARRRIGAHRWIAQLNDRTRSPALEQRGSRWAPVDRPRPIGVQQRVSVAWTEHESRSIRPSDRFGAAYSSWSPAIGPGARARRVRTRWRSTIGRVFDIAARDCKGLRTRLRGDRDQVATNPQRVTEACELGRIKIAIGLSTPPAHDKQLTRSGRDLREKTTTARVFLEASESLQSRPDFLRCTPKKVAVLQGTRLSWRPCNTTPNKPAGGTGQASTSIPRRRNAVDASRYPSLARSGRTKHRCSKSCSTRQAIVRRLTSEFDRQRWAIPVPASCAEDDRQLARIPDQ